MKTTNNTILITGGGSGIGEALAHRFHDMGNKVIIAGRRKEALEKAAAGRDNIHVLQVDMDDAQGSDKFISLLLSQYPDVNVLINNAGIMRRESLDARRNLKDAQEMITTNLLGPIWLINGMIEHLMHQPHAVIINVSSGLAFVPMALAPTYSATKAALHSYTVSLREALKGKVEVIELAPPAVQTDLTPGQSTREGYQPLKEFADEVISLFQQTPTPSEILVEKVHFLRFAEAENRFDQTLNALSGFMRQVVDKEK